MALRIITADERQAEERGVKAAILGKPGMGKTWLLNTTCAVTTLFMDLEAGDLATQGAQEMGLLQLAGLLLKAEVEDLLPQLLLA
jgi:2-keto-4-pentenoate hydratase